jgi:hypothetical protein
VPTYPTPQVPIANITNNPPNSHCSYILPPGDLLYNT